MGTTVKLPLGASYAQICKATDAELADLLAREAAAKEAKIREAQRIAALPDSNDLVAQANDRILEARAALTKRNGLRIDERWPSELPPKEKK